MNTPILAYFDTNALDAVLRRNRLMCETLEEYVRGKALYILLSEENVVELLGIWGRCEGTDPPGLCARLRRLCPDTHNHGNSHVTLRLAIERHNSQDSTHLLPRSDLLNHVIGTLQSRGEHRVLLGHVKKLASGWADRWTCTSDKAAPLFAQYRHRSNFPTFRDEMLQLSDMPGWVCLAVETWCDMTIPACRDSIRKMRETLRPFRFFLDGFLAHFYTYIHDTPANKKKPQRSDRLDIGHMVFAGFTDCFVTQEGDRKKGLRHRYELIRRPTDPECFNLDEFLRSLQDK